MVTRTRGRRSNWCLLYQSPLISHLPSPTSTLIITHLARAPPAGSKWSVTPSLHCPHHEPRLMGTFLSSHYLNFRHKLARSKVPSTFFVLASFSFHGAISFWFPPTLWLLHCAWLLPHRLIHLSRGVLEGLLQVLLSSPLPTLKGCLSSPMTSSPVQMVLTIASPC